MASSARRRSWRSSRPASSAYLGSRSGPTTIRPIAMMTNSSGQPMPNTGLPYLLQTEYGLGDRHRRVEVTG